MTRPILRLGSRDAGDRHDVQELQRLLVARGAHVTADGIFGVLTLAALRIAQRSLGLIPDGACGPLTWAALLGAEPSRVRLAPLPSKLTWGVDVSSAGQPRPLPWGALYEAGARFAWVRVTVGSTVDLWAVQHAADARAAGLLVGGYGVPRARDRRGAWNEGNNCAVEASRIGAVDLPLWIDLELPDVVHLARAPAADVLAVLDAAAEWCAGAEAEQRGRRCGVYTGPAWLATARQRGGPEAVAALVRLAGVGAERPLWLAQYPLRDVQAGGWPAAPAPLSDPPAIWQVSGDVGAEALLVDGRRVDLDVTRLGVDELRALGR